MSADRVNHAAVTQRLLDLAADIRRRPVVQRRPPDTFMMKACIDAFDKELARVEKLAATYAAECQPAKALIMRPQARTVTAPLVGYRSRVLGASEGSFPAWQALHHTNRRTSSSEVIHY